MELRKVSIFTTCSGHIHKSHKTAHRIQWADKYKGSRWILIKISEKRFSSILGKPIIIFLEYLCSIIVKKCFHA